MFDLRRKKLTFPSFVHADDCKIVKVDPSTEIPWSKTEGGRWEAVCQCSTQYFYEPPDAKTRLDPLDPSTFQHAGGCEYRETTDPAVLRFVLKVQEGAHPSYWWVSCDACQTSWQTWKVATESA